MVHAMVTIKRLFNPLLRACGWTIVSDADGDGYIHHELVAYPYDAIYREHYEGLEQQDIVLSEDDERKREEEYRAARNDIVNRVVVNGRRGLV